MRTRRVAAAVRCCRSAHARLWHDEVVRQDDNEITRTDDNLLGRRHRQRHVRRRAQPTQQRAGRLLLHVSRRATVAAVGCADVSVMDEPDCSLLRQPRGLTDLAETYRDACASAASGMHALRQACMCGAASATASSPLILAHPAGC